MRLIDADALIEAMGEEPYVWSDEPEEIAERNQWLTDMHIIEDAPSIDIVPKRGEWICHKGGWIDFDYYPTKYECNQCHHYVDVASDKNFCPNCGADMREREGE